MNTSDGKFKLYIDCYDAYGLYEENYKRILLIMEHLDSATLIDRKWVSSQAVGGSWARSIRCTFETNVDPRTIKEHMIGLEYCDPETLPKELQKKIETDALRFADIDVIELSWASGGITKFITKIKPIERKVESAALMESTTKSSFVLECRRKLLDSLEPSVKEKLMAIEAEMVSKLVSQDLHHHA